MKTILVPTDFSHNSELALRYAVEIATQFGFHIHLIHIRELPLFERFINEEEIKARSTPAWDELFEQYINKVVASDNSTLEITHVAREGNVTTEIEKYTKEIDPMMIILGYQGGGSDQWDSTLVGGTAQKIIRRVIIPVMVVPPGAEYKPIDHIAYATDFNPEDLDIIAELIGFAKHFNARVTAVHVKENKWDQNEDRIENMRQRFSSELESGKLKIEITEHDNVIKGLDQYIASKEVTLLAVLKKYHNLWDRLVDQGMAMKIALNTTIPSLVFKQT